jgi:2-iminobutanoate/2-iminopropanoate deaminase
MSKEALTSPEIAPPLGSFSPGVRAGEFVFLSGQIAQDPATGALITGDVTAQTEQVFKNLRAVLEAAGKTFDDVVKVSVYLTDMAHFPAMNAVYDRYFRAPYPARSTIAVAQLALGATVGMDLIAR